MGIKNLKNILHRRFGGILLLYLVFISISLVSRTVLLSMSFKDVSFNPLNIIWSYGAGLFMDTVAFSYFMIPFVLFLMFVSDRIFNSAFHRNFAYVAYFITFYILLFNGVSEYFFWEEFGVRYNFIAVDYLVYTTEVLGNIKESYPLPLLVSGILFADILLTYLVVKKKLLVGSLASKSIVKSRLKTGLVLLCIPALSFILIKNTTVEITKNRYNNELAKNGIHSLFAAFLNSELDYDLFYAVHDNQENFKQLRSLLKSENSKYLSNEPLDITREITNSGEEKRYNVVFITVESLSAEFLGFKRNKKENPWDFSGNVTKYKGNVTPYLDAIADSSLLFTNLYAVGTRTIYGLEAVTLGAPPKPGQSVVKRANNENMFSVGQIFKERGYDLKYIYGGYGYFDNMNYFFSHNGYQIVDRSDLKEDEITFKNAWGVCDQDLFNRTLKECDKSFAAGKPFLNHLMTTSNHRPFTYPDGVIDIPSHTTRAGGIKYCDFAIGEFIQKASEKPWFKNTIFVIVADHCAGSAGQAELPFMEYQIPFMIYNPGLVRPQQIGKLCSQIDVAPTLLGVMNWSYKTKFFGKDILKMTPEEERAFISNYQKLGYIKNDRLSILSPQQKITHYKINPQTGEMKVEATDPEIENEAIIYYQSANYVYKNKLNKWD
ncbi:sulfatase family protein [Aquipluma nitroreducens]|uniref:Sulfatase family protein n=1 Tax=Aquipluma nitroreducens TaxID=2010828 RepID=A0A5K7SGN4_9BACT|nr:LTA synthase family protein [Aquipluma nitroreducens]BBE20728.1 sulfatase family protein [Aquipluma nitroreducens]